MELKYNYMAFTPEEVENGMVASTLTFLLHANKISEDHFNDIHVWSDGYCTIVEWIWKDYSGDLERGSFEYVGYDQEVCDVYSNIDPDDEIPGSEPSWEDRKFTRCEGCQHWNPKDEYCYILDTNMNRTDFCSRAEPKDI